jgi:folate-binding Fe-S cluster repair protein YgfZ
VIHFDVFIVPYNGNIKYNTNGTDSEMQLRYIKIYIIFGKNNIKGVENKKKYFNSNV